MSALAIYRNEQHAIIRAMSVDSISTCKPSQCHLCLFALALSN